MKDNAGSLILSAVGLLSVLYIIFSGPVFVLNVPFLLMQFFGLLLIGWALLARKVNKSSHDGKLPGKHVFMNSGPYEIIRHPIYAGFLLFMSGLVEEEISMWRFFAFGILAAVVILKIIGDELLLDSNIKEYAAYKAKTFKLIPYVY